jgi:hypothetical protein
MTSILRSGHKGRLCCSWSDHFEKAEKADGKQVGKHSL